MSDKRDNESVGEAVSFPAPLGNPPDRKLAASPTENAARWIELCPGIRRRTLSHGKALYQMLAQLDAGSTMPAHSHAQEQITHILSGRVVMILDGVRHDLKAGESLLIPSNVSHGAETIEQALVLDTFSPPRDDYLERDREQSASAV